MLKERKPIKDQLYRLITGNNYQDLKDILEDLAQVKFIEIQSNPESKSHADLIADRKILNFYINFTRDLEFRLKQIEKDQEAQNIKKIEDFQRESD